jgi:hypothetical protein
MTRPITFGWGSEIKKAIAVTSGNSFFIGVARKIAWASGIDRMLEQGVHKGRQR